MRVIETSLEEDLSSFSRFLREKRVPHRIFEERGRQIVEVATADWAGPVRQAYQDWRAGGLKLRVDAPVQGAGPGVSDRLVKLGRTLRPYPVLTAMVGLALLIYPFSSPVANGKLTAVAAWLTIVDLSLPVEEGYSALFEGELWRWLTPILLHFSVVHLLFNLAVTVDFGRRVEFGRGSARFALIVLLIALASNLGQFLLAGNPLFGGLSGVAYGLLGYVLMSQRRFPDQHTWQVHQGFAWSLLLFLVLFSTGVTEPFGLHVANAAHWIGLGSGALLAWLVPLSSRQAGRSGD